MLQSSEVQYSSIIYSDMDSDLISFAKCWLCPESARAKAKWSCVMDEKVAESICKLLCLDIESLFEFFKAAEYCGSCQEFVLEIDFLMRTMCEIKAKILEARTLLSQAVLKNFDILVNPGETFDIDDPDDPVFQNEQTSPQATRAAVAGAFIPNSPINLEQSENIAEKSSIIPIQVEIPETIPEFPYYSAISPESVELSANRRQTRSSVKRNSQKPSVSYRELLSAAESDFDCSASNADPDFEGSSDSDSDVDLSEIRIERVFSEEFEARLPSTTDELDTEPVLCENPVTELTKNKLRTFILERLARRKALNTLKDVIASDDVPILTSALQSEVIEASSQEDEYETDASDASNTRRRKTLASKIARKYSDNPIHRNLSIPNKHLLNLEIKTTYRDLRYHCFAENCTRKYFRISHINRHISKKHPELVTPKDTNTNPKTFLCRALECSFSSELANELYSHFNEAHKTNSVVKKMVELTEEQSEPKEDGRVHCFHDNCSRSYLTAVQLKNHIHKCHTDPTLEEEAVRKDPPRPRKSVPCGMGSTRNVKVTVQNNLHHSQEESTGPAGPFSEIRNRDPDTESSSTKTPDVEQIPVENADARKERNIAKILRQSIQKRKLQQLKAVGGSVADENNDINGNDGSNSEVNTVPPNKRTRKSTDMKKFRRMAKNQQNLEIKTTKKDGKFHCFHANCTKKYTRVRQVKIHISAEHTGLIPTDEDRNIYRCRATGCSFTSESGIELYAHFEESHEPRTDKNKVHLTQKQRQPREDGRIPCFHDNCSKSYKEACDLRHHIHMWHVKRTPKEDEEMNRFRCTEADCSFFTRTSRALQVHVNKVHQNDPRPYKCLHCCKKFAKQRMLIMHNNAHHRPKEFVCHLCGRQHARKSKLYVHMVKCHNDEEGFKCSVCFQKFFFKEDCDKHEAKHVPGEPLKCLVMGCQTVFENQETLRQHVADSHFNAKKYFCEQCGTYFSEGYNLRTHQKTHTDIFDFPCTDCDKRFRMKHQLQSHIETMHAAGGGQVYPCTLCDETFHCRSYLYKHTSWHKHGDNANKPLKLQKKIVNSSDEDE